MSEPKATLPADARAFYAAASELDRLRPPASSATSALERLGPSPFPKSPFPFLGFLATVYDHVADRVKPK